MSSAIPIRTPGEQSIPLQFSRDSFAHSQGMGGISWGGASVGSWLRDEVLMATKENNQNNHFHNSLLSGFDLHAHAAGADLPPEGGNSSQINAQQISNQHSSSHIADFPDQLAYFPSIEANFCKDYSCCGNMLPTLHDLLRHYEEQHISPSPPDEPPVMRRVQNIETVSTNDVFLPFDQPRHAQDLGLSVHGMDLDGLDLGLAGLTGAPGVAGNGAGAGNGEQHAFAPPSFQPLTQDMLTHGVNTKQNNMNAGTNMLNGLEPGAAGVGNLRSLNNMNAGVMHGDITQAGLLNPLAARQMGNPAAAAALLGDDDEPTIDDPARQLYMLERTENKPFKCPVIGCEKTYKNQNGLKYHRQHGHQNQTLHLNDDGTYSIIDPLSNTPYPDGMGMEKDKPYRCEICGKRYKNLNGLKYHRAHSTH